MQPKKTTITEIALRLNISPSTVSRALQDHKRISSETISKVKQMAEKLNYEPNNLASALRNGKSKIIGIIVPIINRHFFASFISGVEEIANSFDYKVIICQTYDDYSNELKTVDALLSAQVDGILASVAKNSFDFSHYQKVLDRKIPLVLFDRETPEIQTSQVVIDDYFAAYTITENLINQGCRNIAHLTSNHKITLYKNRLQGHLDALSDNNIEINPNLIVESALHLEDGRKSMQQLLQLNTNLDAVFSASDYAIMGAMQVCKENGISIPENIALAGFGNEPFTAFTSPEITTVNQKSIEMGIKAAQLFFEMSENKNFTPQKIILTPEVIFRNSTKLKK